ncbi:MAG: Phosphate transport system permease protein PstC [Opitutia bacterium UBA7350]|nr:MAG: Phosphate transport system permease protein PstC [Opitutae bacterium UBA7350]
MSAEKKVHPKQADFHRKRAIAFGKDSDSIIKAFFGSSATIAIVVLGLITLFLFKEGAGFLKLYHTSLKEYRLSGLEYVDILKEKRDDYTALSRYLTDIRADWINHLKDSGMSAKEIAVTVRTPEAKAFFMGYMRNGSEMRRFIKEKMDVAIEIRDQHTTNKNLGDTLANYTKKIEAVKNPNYILNEEDRARFILLLKESLNNGEISIEVRTERQFRYGELEQETPLEASDLLLYLQLLEEQYNATERKIKPIDFDMAVLEVTSNYDIYAEILRKQALSIQVALAHAEALNFSHPELAQRVLRFKELNELYFDSNDAHLEKLAQWDPSAKTLFLRTLASFLMGKEWITASDQQDWYGLLPLLVGSLLISVIALFFAIPFGVGAAIYVNQIASPLERNLIKPYIEFVSAIPSVVIGFFGVVVFGEAIRLFSQLDFLSWMPFFPIQERLNAFTAGCLLALMAIPTIFTLAEDAINNIPRHFKEASYAVGATQLQTTLRVIVPTALSGIISAVMLGFGRVIGETMVVLLCAGNRITIPDFSEGIGVFFQPVHTMTGIIAQEMGEVVHGSVHYRALFMVGIVLFFISLIINYSAQWVVKKYRKVGD